MNEDPKYVLIKYRLAMAEEMLTDARKLLEVQGSPRSIVNRSYLRHVLRCLGTSYDDRHGIRQA